MKTYRHTKTTVSKIKYFFVFCPRYKRKIFLIPNVEKRFTDLVYQECQKIDVTVINIKCNIDHVMLLLESSPFLSPAEIMKCLKGGTSRTLREEFPELSAMPSLWTKNFFVSTEDDVSDEIINQYVNKQKKHP